MKRLKTILCATAAGILLVAAPYATANATMDISVGTEPPVSELPEDFEPETSIVELYTAYFEYDVQAEDVYGEESVSVANEEQMLGLQWMSEQGLDDSIENYLLWLQSDVYASYAEEHDLPTFESTEPSGEITEEETTSSAIPVLLSR